MTWLHLVKKSQKFNYFFRIVSSCWDFIWNHIKAADRWSFNWRQRLFQERWHSVPDSLGQKGKLISHSSSFGFLFWIDLIKKRNNGRGHEQIYTLFKWNAFPLVAARWWKFFFFFRFLPPAPSIDIVVVGNAIRGRVSSITGRLKPTANRAEVMYRKIPRRGDLSRSRTADKADHARLMPYNVGCRCLQHRFKDLECYGPTCCHIYPRIYFA